jgi:hypothetical protein
MKKSRDSFSTSILLSTNFGSGTPTGGGCVVAKNFFVVARSFGVTFGVDWVVDKTLVKAFTRKPIRVFDLACGTADVRLGLVTR